MNLTKTKEHRLSTGEKLSYGFGDCAANVYVAMASTFLTAYYTDTVGLAALAVGTMMLVARIFDGVTDLVMGAIVDKTNSKYGKARPWVLWSAPFMLIGLVLLFSVPSGISDSGKLIYAYVTYIFMNCIVYTANNLPYNALLSRMTLNVQDRATTASIRFVMTQFTTLIINAVTANLISSLGWFWLALMYGIIEVVMLLICFFGCKEHLDEDESGVVTVENVPLKTALPALLRNKYFYLQALLFLFLYVNTVCVGSTTYYFCNIILGNVGVITLTSMSQTIPAIIANFINPSLVQKFGKRKVMIVGSILMILGSSLVGMAGANIPLVMIGIAIKGFGYFGAILAAVCLVIVLLMDIDKYIKQIQADLQAKRA